MVRKSTTLPERSGAGSRPSWVIQRTPDASRGSCPVDGEVPRDSQQPPPEEAFFDRNSPAWRHARNSVSGSTIRRPVGRVREYRGTVCPKQQADQCLVRCFPLRADPWDPSSVKSSGSGLAKMKVSVFPELMERGFPCCRRNCTGNTF
jgi:hypothetical protein